MGSWHEDSEGIKALMQSEPVRAYAESIAHTYAAVAQARVPASDKRFKMPDFCVRSYTNAGSSRHDTALAIIVATNPRSNWHAINRGALDVF